VATTIFLLAEEGDGLAIAKELMATIDSIGWHRWQQIVARTPHKVRLLLVGAMFTPALSSRSRLNALTMNYELVEAIKVPYRGNKVSCQTN